MTLADLSEWMAGWEFRSAVLNRPPVGLVSGRSGDFDVAVAHSGREWRVTVSRVEPEESMEAMRDRKQAEGAYWNERRAAWAR